MTVPEELGSNPSPDPDRLRNRASARQAPSALNRKTHFWLRLVHVYSSMLALLIVLFFGITGLTLNHPDWTFGDESTIKTVTGTLPVDVVAGPRTEFLMVSEFARAEHDIKGAVTDFGITEGEGTITYKTAGYSAAMFFATDTGVYEIDIQQEGFVAVMNDLHKGRDTSSMWSLVIDISAVFLVLIAATGLGIQFFLRKRRMSALSLAGVGTVLGIILIWLATL